MKNRIVAVAVALMAAAAGIELIRGGADVMARTAPGCALCASTGVQECGTCAGTGGRDEPCCACRGDGELSCSGCRGR